MAGLSPDGNRRPTLLVNTIKVAAAVALISYVAANWLSSEAFDQSGLARLASSRPRVEDPVSTGSIAASARQTRLDPCAVPPRR